MINLAKETWARYSSTKGNVGQGLGCFHRGNTSCVATESRKERRDFGWILPHVPGPQLEAAYSSSVEIKVL